MRSPHLLKLNGTCGGVAPQRLALLVGDGVDACPTAMGMERTEVIAAGALLPSATSLGVFGDDATVSLPPRWRWMVGLARGWAAEFENKQREVSP